MRTIENKAMKQRKHLYKLLESFTEKDLYVVKSFVEFLLRQKQMFITSNVPVQIRTADFRVTELHSTGLPKPSIIRMKLATINKSIIIKKLGQLSQTDRMNFQRLLIEFLA